MKQKKKNHDISKFTEPKGSRNQNHLRNQNCLRHQKGQDTKNRSQHQAGRNSKIVQDSQKVVTLRSLETPDRLADIVRDAKRSRHQDRS